MIHAIPTPVSPRQMLLAFATYEAERGLPSVLRRLDFAGVTRRQVYFAVLGRTPERGATAIDGPGFNARQAVAHALRGEEFQSRIREIALAAFPEKKRVVFIHIPKCAGTDLQALLKRRYPFLAQQLSLPEATDKEGLFAFLRDFSIALGLSDSIAISGHVPLRWYLDRGLLRFEDDVFTTVRHPRDIMYSYISFILTRCVEFQGTRRNDTASWLAPLGMTDIEPGASPAYLADLGSRLLQSRKIAQANVICHHLGNGTAASALETMMITDIEITDTTRYSAWRTAKFASPPEQRINPSRPLFTPETATAADRALIEDLVGEDVILYEKIMGKLNAQDGLSIRGRVFG